MHEQILLPVSELDLDVLQRPDMSDADQSDSDINSVQDDMEDYDRVPWLNNDCTPPDLPFTDGPLQDLLLEPAGVFVNEQGELTLSMCRECSKSIENGVLPLISLANRLFLGQIPPELKDLTPVEESMIALYRAKSCIVQLKEENESASNSINQRGLKGHIIIYPQRPEHLVSVLPPTVDNIITPICVLFVGSSPPTAE
jgi:hypothetical protein